MVQLYTCVFYKLVFIVCIWPALESVIQQKISRLIMVSFVYVQNLKKNIISKVPIHYWNLQLSSNNLNQCNV